MPGFEPPARLADHRILLVNDDGVHARGVELLEELVRGITDDVWVVCPDEEKSGASHSVSFATPVRVRKLGDRRFAVKGTPTDCVLIAVWDLMKDRAPTAVIAGINHGENLAEDVTYSGTAGPAIEGAVLGFRSIAVSQVYELGGQPRQDTPRHFGPAILRQLLSCEWEPGTLVNVNFPDVAPDQVSGVRVTRQGRRLPGSFKPVQGRDGRNVPYYWMKIDYDPGPIVAGTDLEAMRDRAVSITPLQVVDLTAQAFAARLTQAFAGPGS
jgi:5'-nucleotidase